MTPICDICKADLDPDSYSEMLLKKHTGPLSATMTQSVGYLCRDCSQWFQDGLAGAAPSRIEKPASGDRQTCQCGCGRLAKPGKRFLRGHAGGRRRRDSCGEVKI